MACEPNGATALAPLAQSGVGEPTDASRLGNGRVGSRWPNYIPSAVNTRLRC